MLAPLAARWHGLVSGVMIASPRTKRNRGVEHFAEVEDGVRVEVAAESTTRNGGVFENGCGRDAGESGKG